VIDGASVTAIAAAFTTAGPTAASTVLLVAGGALIGFLLAVLGAGGSILLLPLLVSGAGLSTRDAVPLSLLVVTLLALANAGPYLHRRQVAPGPALVLGVPALAGSWIGGSLVKAGLVPEPVQLGIFNGSALLAAWLLSRHGIPRQGRRHPRRGGHPVTMAVQGVLVGLLTGIAVGAAAGQRLAPHLGERRLRQGFAALLIGSALLTGFEAWRRHGQSLPSPASRLPPTMGFTPPPGRG
jgi:uncharacterized membrane protein YfcA